MLEPVEATRKLFPDRDWQPVEDPATGQCVLPDGTYGSVWTYVLNTSTRGPLSDVAKVEAFWHARGIRTHLLSKTVPDDGERGLIGYPNDLDSIGYYRSTVKNQINAQSVCFEDPARNETRTEPKAKLPRDLRDRMAALYMRTASSACTSSSPRGRHVTPPASRRLWTVPRCTWKRTASSPIDAPPRMP